MAIMMGMAPGSHMTMSDVLAALKGFSLEELDRVVAAAEQERQAKREAARKALLEEMRSKAQALGLSLEGLLQVTQPEEAPARGRRAPVRPKYRHPGTGETWSGRGSAPAWLRRLEQDGRSREDFAVGN
jgi:DNA-binding protein H-NS